MTGTNGKHLTRPYADTIFFQKSDANHDRKCDINDLYRISSNWNQTGKNFADGDLNYDGTVNSADLGILSANWQAFFPAPTPFNVWSISTKQINLSWDDNTIGEDGWWLQWSNDGHTFNNTNRISLPANTTHWEDNGTLTGGLSPETRRWYRVRAHGNETSSNTVYSIKQAARTLDLGSAMSETINGMIDGLTASAATESLYSFADDYLGPHGSYVRNTSLWAKDVDFSCIPVWNSFWASRWKGEVDNGVLVTPKYLIQAAHFGTISSPDSGAMAPGTTIRFVDANNNVVERIVADNNPNDDVASPNDPHNPNGLPNFYNGIVIPGTDIRIIELTQALPSNIKPAKVFPSNIASYLPGISGGIPVAFTNQFRSLQIGTWNYSNAFNIITEPPSNTVYHPWYPEGPSGTGPITGDSSSGVLGIIDNTPILLGTWASAAATPNISYYLSAINAALGSGNSLIEYNPNSP